MGAAGISCSSSEMSAKGQCGMTIDLNKVPMREENMSAYELLLSESQERMLICAQKGREQEIIDVFSKWDLNAVVIGEVNDSGRLYFHQHNELKADMPAESLVLGGGAPVYIRETKEPHYLKIVQGFDQKTLEEPSDYGEIVIKLLHSPNIASKRWVYEQYDTMVRTNTVAGPGPTDAAVVRVKGTRKGLAIKTDCNGRYVYLNPRKGAQIAVAEAARNIVCSGGKPLAVTNCLNFGNPYKPEVYWVFKEAVTGMGEACELFNTPVTGGNVSFYNENEKGAVFPTPTIGMLGLVEDIQQDTITFPFKNDSNLVIYIGAPRLGLGGSEYLSWIHDKTVGDAPHLDMEFEKHLQDSLLAMIRRGLIESAHDISDGGLAITLAEMALFSGKGAELDLDDMEGTRTEILFSEAQSGVVVEISPDNWDDFEGFCREEELPMHHLGSVGGESLDIEGTFRIPVSEMKEIYESVIPNAMQPFKEKV